jgi:hypothetical protein
MTTLPLWAWIAGVVVLGLAIAYGTWRSGRRTHQEEVISDAATEERYKQENHSS